MARVQRDTTKFVPSELPDRGWGVSIWCTALGNPLAVTGREQLCWGACSAGSEECCVSRAGVWRQNAPYAPL